MMYAIYSCDLCGAEFRSDFYACPAVPLFNVSVSLVQNHAHASFVRYGQPGDERRGRCAASTNGQISFHACAGCLTRLPVFTRLEVVLPQHREGEPEQAGAAGEADGATEGSDTPEADEQ